MGTRYEFSDGYSDTTDDDSSEEMMEDESIESKKSNINDGPLSRGVLQAWDQVYMLVCTAGMFVDPLIFYALSISESRMCVFLDGWFALTVTVVRCMMDVLHVANMWVEFKANRWRTLRYNDVGLRHDDRGSCKRKRNLANWVLNIFVILPIPQVLLWVVIPTLLKKGWSTRIMTVCLLVFLFLYLPKVYHAAHRLRRMLTLSGYLFGTIWWGIAITMIAYLIAAHAVGACWYLLGMQRVATCLKEKCMEANGRCSTRVLACQNPVYYGTNSFVKYRMRVLWASNKDARSFCLDNQDDFGYGVYKWTLQLVANDSRMEKLFLPIFWGLMMLTTFGNLDSTTSWLECVFLIIVLSMALFMVTMLIATLKVFLHATTSKKQAMTLRLRNLEWWMRRRNLPLGLRQRVRNYELQQWAAMRGVDEVEMIENLPDGLRRDIKYHLCLDLVRQVPLFQHMDALVLENICDRVKSLIFTKGETIAREGDPVQRMLFIVRGHVQSSQVLRDGVKSCCMLGPGNFSGDELLSWCLKRPFIRRLPPSSSTLVTLETIEAFGLEANDVWYVTHHFRYTFVNEKVKRSARYYSPGWRTWAAVALQLAWRRYRQRLNLTSLPLIRPRRPLSSCSSSFGEDKLRLYAALLTSAKPNQDDFDF